MTEPVRPTNKLPQNDNAAALPGISVRLLPDGAGRRLAGTQRIPTPHFDAQYGGRLSPLI